MFCKKCGKEINNDASFCPYCGTVIMQEQPIADDSVITKERSAVDRSAMDKIPMYGKNRKQKKKRKFLPFFIVIAIIVLIFPIKNYIEKTIVKSIAEDYLQMVKDGPDAETMDDIVVQLLYGFTGSTTLTNLVHSQIKGEDVRDLYDAVMLHMDYEVKNVEKIGSGHYRITVRIENMNNVTVASEAWKLFISRYKDGGFFDGLKLAKEDLLSDKSTMISSFIIEASNDLYAHDKISNMVAGIHIIDVIKTDDGWDPSFENGVDTFIFDCAGIPY